MSFKVMKQKYHLISSIISMTITSVLLIVVCLAWYVTNKEASVTGITGSIVEATPLIEKVEYYEATAKTSTSFTFTKSNDADSIEMGTYNPLDSELCPQRMIAITLKSGVSSVNISVKSRATSYLGATIKDGEGNFILSKDNPNSLTSVIGFYIPTAVSVDDEGVVTTTIDSSDEKYFVNATTDEMITNLDLGDVTPKENVVYIILDYYEDSIEHIYSENIGNSALDYVGEPTAEKPHINDIKYECDFYFMLKEGA